eukprot:CAMPEP_0202701212 /NCGR_PEP_ID=MMETSP1385-20130828/14313_1 /ASSEMBLY_ACC=CAM_ASM_000861 /TAXON_ID=933848 /ORGANISM="Elphidium margaritaceum" /LENGTH=186 /DNA_ID=CAMNT_0049358577 /DNA_START=1 /DNA_END=558 /DNA_ORIENTATION=+
MICCDFCNIWFHRSCARLSTTQYNKLSKSNSKWFCATHRHQRSRTNSTIQNQHNENNTHTCTTPIANQPSQAKKKTKTKSKSKSGSKSRHKKSRKRRRPFSPAKRTLPSAESSASGTGSDVNTTSIQSRSKRRRLMNHHTIHTSSSLDDGIQLISDALSAAKVGDATDLDATLLSPSKQTSSRNDS